MDFPYLLVVPYPTKLVVTTADISKSAVCVEKCPQKGYTVRCLPTTQTTCADFAQTGESTTRVLTSCLDTAAADAASADIKKSVDELEANLKVFGHFAW